MTCERCGKYAEPDLQTGHDAETLCAGCAWDDVDPIESDLHDLGSVLASLADLVKDCHDPAKLFDVYCELGQIAKASMELQDVIGLKIGAVK